ncbi:MAG: RsmD family RNA methyltransferase [Candidatus Omnitrophota bacterium]
MKEYPPVSLQIQEMNPAGQGLAIKDGKTYLVWNALAGEKVIARICGKSKHAFDAVALEIIEPSADRISSVESHHLSCSPWQIMSRPAEDRLKHQILCRLIEQLWPDLDKTLLPGPLVSGAQDFGYRNKMEYSFIETDDRVRLAFFDRGTHRRTAIEPCVLADDAINRAARSVLGRLRQSAASHGGMLKSLILRSDGRQGVLAGLFVMREVDAASLGLDRPVEGCDGFFLYYSRPSSPASTTDRLLVHWGADTLEMRVLDSVLKMGLLSFFQVNAQLFAGVVADLKALVGSGETLLDYYSGVGSIGINLARVFKQCLLIDNSPENIRFAAENIQAAGLTNTRAILTPAEKALDFIETGCTVILDPPRSGLHPKLIERLLSVRPVRVLYLSCSPVTLARDLELLKSAYRLTAVKGYNFFPRTPHIECLCVLERTELSVR